MHSDATANGGVNQLLDVVGQRTIDLQHLTSCYFVCFVPISFVRFVRSRLYLPERELPASE
jgi:hypothetical protein